MCVVWLVFPFNWWYFDLIVVCGSLAVSFPSTNWDGFSKLSLGIIEKARTADEIGRNSGSWFSDFYFLKRVIGSSDLLHFLLAPNGLVMKIIKADTCVISTQWLCKIIKAGIIVDVTQMSEIEVQRGWVDCPMSQSWEKNGDSNPSLSGSKFWVLLFWIEAFIPCRCSVWSTSEPWLKVYISLQILLNCGRQANLNWSDIGWNFFIESGSLVSKWKEDHKTTENHLTERGKNHLG